LAETAKWGDLWAAGLSAIFERAAAQRLAQIAAKAAKNAGVPAVAEPKPAPPTAPTLRDQVRGLALAPDMKSADLWIFLEPQVHKSPQRAAASASGYPLFGTSAVQPIGGIGASGQLVCMLPSAKRAGPHLRGSVVSPGTIPPGLIVRAVGFLRGVSIDPNKTGAAGVSNAAERTHRRERRIVELEEASGRRTGGHLYREAIPRRRVLRAPRSRRLPEGRGTHRALREEGAHFSLPETCPCCGQSRPTCEIA
jgi:hypothetical protein